jgi:hypothetical protein
MGLFFAVSQGLILGMSHGINGVLLEISIGLGGGLVAGVLFGFFISVFVKVQTKKFEPLRHQMAEQHKIVFEGGANHFLNKEGVGGWLFLTSELLFFKSHKFNIQKHELSIPISIIKSVNPCKLLKFAKTGLKIEKIDGTLETFAVNNPDEWTAKINELIVK